MNAKIIERLAFPYEVERVGGGESFRLNTAAADLPLVFLAPDLRSLAAYVPVPTVSMKIMFP